MEEAPNEPIRIPMKPLMTAHYIAYVMDIAVLAIVDCPVPTAIA